MLHAIRTVPVAITMTIMEDQDPIFALCAMPPAQAAQVTLIPANPVLQVSIYTTKPASRIAPLATSHSTPPKSVSYVQHPALMWIFPFPSQMQ